MGGGGRSQEIGHPLCDGVFLVPAVFRVQGGEVTVLLRLFGNKTELLIDRCRELKARTCVSAFCVWNFP